MKPKVLIVDDDEEIRSQMKWALLQDYDVLLAEDRPSAIAVFRESRPMVVVLDLGQKIAEATNVCTENVVDTYRTDLIARF